MKVFSIIVAFIIIGICTFLLVRWSIQLVKAIKERRNKKKGEENKEE